MSFVEVLVISLVGFLTVFLILMMVWLLGMLLIKITNRFEIKTEKAVLPSSRSSVASSQGATTNRKKKIAAIIAAVKILTQGRGNVTKITDIDNKVKA